MDEVGEISTKREIIASQEKEKKLKSYKEVVEVFSERLSWHRLRRLLNTEKVEGEKRYIKGVKGYPWRWFTTVDNVKKYLESLKTPSEYGKMKPRGERKRGRPKKEVIKKGVVFQTS